MSATERSSPRALRRLLSWMFAEMLRCSTDAYEILKGTHIRSTCLRATGSCGDVNTALEKLPEINLSRGEASLRPKKPGAAHLMPTEKLPGARARELVPTSGGRPPRSETPTGSFRLAGMDTPASVFSTFGSSFRKHRLEGDRVFGGCGNPGFCCFRCGPNYSHPRPHSWGFGT